MCIFVHLNICICAYKCACKFVYYYRNAVYPRVCIYACALHICTSEYIIVHVHICKFVYYYRNAVYPRVCIYAVLSPLLIHCQLIELVVRNTRERGGSIWFNRCLYFQLWSWCQICNGRFLWCTDQQKDFVRLSENNWKAGFAIAHYALLQLDTALWFRLF